MHAKTNMPQQRKYFGRCHNKYETANMPEDTFQNIPEQISLIMPERV
jgi:hypothetical protein